MRKEFLLLTAIVALSSCSITKRHYAPGYHVEWKSLRKTEVCVGAREILELSSDEVAINDTVLSSAIWASDQNEDVIYTNGSTQRTINIQEQRDTTIVEDKEQDEFLNSPVEAKSTSKEIKEKPQIDQSCYINKMALTGFILVITSPIFFGITFIPGLICSYLGYEQIEEGNGIGKGLAKTGLIFGLAVLAAVIISFLFFIVYSLITGIH